MSDDERDEENNVAPEDLDETQQGTEEEEGSPGRAPQVETTAVLEPVVEEEEEEPLPPEKPWDNKFHALVLPSPFAKSGASHLVSVDTTATLPPWLRYLLADDVFYFDRIVFPAPPKPKKKQAPQQVAAPVEGEDGEEPVAEEEPAQEEGEEQAAKAPPPQINAKELFSIVKWSDATFTLTSWTSLEALSSASAKSPADASRKKKAPAAESPSEEADATLGSPQDTDIEGKTDDAALPPAAASGSAPGSKTNTPRVPAADPAAAPAAIAQRTPVAVLAVDVLTLAALQSHAALASLFQRLPHQSFCLDYFTSFLAGIDDAEISRQLADVFSAAKTEAAGPKAVFSRMFFDVQPFFDSLRENALHYDKIERALVAILRVGGVPRLSGAAPPPPPTQAASGDAAGEEGAEAGGDDGGEGGAAADDGTSPVAVPLTDRLQVRTPESCALFLAMLFHMPRSALTSWMLPAPPATADEEPEVLEDEVKRTKPVAYALGQVLLELRRRAARVGHGKPLMREPLAKALLPFLNDLKRRFPIEAVGSDLDPLITAEFVAGNSGVHRTLHHSDLVVLLLALAPSFSRHVLPLHAGTEEQAVHVAQQLADATLSIQTFQTLFEAKIALPKRSLQSDTTSLFELLLHNCHLMSGPMGRQLWATLPLWASEGRGIFGQASGLAPWPTLAQQYMTPNVTNAISNDTECNQKCRVQRAKYFLTEFGNVCALRFWDELLADVPSVTQGEVDEDADLTTSILKLLAREDEAASGNKKKAGAASTLREILLQAKAQFDKVAAVFVESVGEDNDDALPLSDLWKHKEGDLVTASSSTASSTWSSKKSGNPSTSVVASAIAAAVTTAVPPPPPPMPHGNARWSLTPIAKFLMEKLPPWSNGGDGDAYGNVKTISPETAFTPRLLRCAVDARNWDAVAFLVVVHRITQLSVDATGPSSATKHILEDALQRKDMEALEVLTRLGVSLRHRVDNGLRSGLAAIQDVLSSGAPYAADDEQTSAKGTKEEILRAWRCVEARRIADPDSQHGLLLNVRD